MIPANGILIHIRDLLASFLHFPHARQDTFIRLLMTEIGRSHGFLANSATTLIHIVLKALRKFSNRREVILPAYTAPLLMLAIHKAGLTPKPCDISLETFQLDLCELQDCLSSQTLAVLGVHSFGIPVQIHAFVNSQATIEVTSLRMPLSRMVLDSPKNLPDRLGMSALLVLIVGRT